MRQNQDNTYLSKLQDYYAAHKLLPSYARIASICGIRSKGTASALVFRLKKEGYVEHSPGRRLVPTSKFFARPHVGAAPAGFPSPAEEHLQDAITIDDYLVEHPSRTVLVEVQGESMIESGIHDGDFVIVERCEHACVGQIVVGIVDGEFTIKYLARDHCGYILRPANPEFSDIRPEGELKIFGVVTGQFRKYPGT